MKYSPLYFAKNMPKDKHQSIPLICKIFYRPIGYVVSSFFALLHISANAVSILNLCVAIASVVLLFFNKTCGIISAGLFSLWVLLDNVDGNLARCVKKQKYGDFFDAVSGYFIGGFYLIGLGFYIFNNGGVFMETGFVYALLIGAVACSSQVSLYLYNKKFEENTHVHYPETINQDKKAKPLYYRIAWGIINELSYGGIMSIVVLFAIIFNFTDIVLIAYSALYILLFLAGLAVLILKGILANHRK